MAVEFVCTRGYNYLHILCKTFRLKSDNNEYLAECIDLARLSTKKLKERINVIEALGLQVTDVQK